MSTIVTRAGKGSALTHNEVDANFTNLNTDKIQSGDTVASLTITSADVNGGTIDGTAIGGSSASSGAFTTLSASSTVSGTGFSTYLASPPSIGGTAAAAGSFTTLTTSSTVTHNGGTANGVMYLNGSKVATTGTALVFDGTNLGIGTSSPTGISGGKTLQIFGGASPSEINITRTTGADFNMIAGASAAQIGTQTNYPLTIITNGSVKATLDTSGNLGLGVTPSARPGQAASYYVLQVGKFAFLDIVGSTGRIAFNAYIDSVGTNRYIANGFVTRYDQSSGTHTWYTAASGTAGAAITWTQAMTLDASGQLGVGVTSPSGILHVSNSSANQFYIERTGATTGRYRLGIANNNNNFWIYDDAQAATRIAIDGSGNVGIGTTSPSTFGKLAVYGSGTAPVISAFLGSNSPAANATLADISFGARTDGTVTAIIRAIANDNTNGTDGQLTFWTADNTASAAATEKMRIDTSGNLGIGLTSPTARLDAYQGTQTNSTFRAYGPAGQILWANGGASTSYLDSDTIIFRKSANSSNTETMRIDSSGNLIVGGTSQLNSALLTVTGSVNSDVSASIINTNTGASANARLDIGNAGYVSSELTLFAYSATATGTVFGINKAKLKAISDNSLAANSNGLVIGTNDANPLYFGTANTERVRIDSSGYTQFNSNLVMPYQGAPTTKSAAATLTGAELVTGILSYTGAAATVNLPTGTNIEGALTWSANNVSMDFFVINTGSGTCTIGANGNTTLGALTVTAATSAQFRIRRTAANTFTVYRLG